MRIAQERGALIRSHTSLFFQHCEGRIIGVTGTKGKSTTASLIQKMLQRQYDDVRLVGNIGTPALELLDGSGPETIFVFELSSFQLEDLQQSPFIAVLLKMYPEHLDHHQSFEAYVEAKCSIFRHQTDQQRLITHSSNTSFIGDSKHGRTTYYDQDLAVPDVSATFVHAENIAAACSVAREMEITQENIERALKEFTPLPHRLEPVATRNGISFINDSLATIPEATIFAIESLGQRLTTLIVGGFDRGISYEKLGQAIGNSNIMNIIVFPTTGELIWNAIPAEKRASMKRVDVEKHARRCGARLRAWRVQQHLPTLSSFFQHQSIRRLQR